MLNKMIDQLIEYEKNNKIKSYTYSESPEWLVVVFNNGTTQHFTTFGETEMSKIKRGVLSTNAKTKPIEYTVNVKRGDKLMCIKEWATSVGDIVEVLEIDDDFDIYVEDESGSKYYIDYADAVCFELMVDEEDEEDEDNTDKEDTGEVKVGQEYVLIDKDGFINHVNRSGITYTENNTSISDNYDKYVIDRVEEGHMGNIYLSKQYQKTRSHYTTVTFDELSKYFKIKDLADNLSGKNDEEVEVENVIDFLSNLFDIKGNSEYTKTIKEAIEQGKSLITDIPSINLSDIATGFKGLEDLLGIKDIEKWEIMGVEVYKGQTIGCTSFVGGDDLSLTLLDVKHEEDKFVIKYLIDDRVTTASLNPYQFKVENGKLVCQGTYVKWTFL